VTVWEVPRFHVSPPFGVVTVIEGADVAEVMVKLLLLVSFIVGWLVL
jgi:hypothetical protein